MRFTTFQIRQASLASLRTAVRIIRRLTRPERETSNGTWEIETALDVEWAHVIAPNANLLLVEANSVLNSDLLTAAVGEAKNWPGLPATADHPVIPLSASVITMSFGLDESPNEGSFDNLFTTPNGRNGITYVGSTGDKGPPGGYPAFSPNVVAVGGTTLSVDGSSNYLGESGWSGSGGRISALRIPAALSE